MSRCRLLACALVAVLALASPMSDSLAQSSESADASQGEVVLTKLSAPVYPPLARQMRIAGDVVVTLGIRRDGSVESAALVSGHPLLVQAVEDSARQSIFECRNCIKPVTTYQMVYTFQVVMPAVTRKAADECGKMFPENPDPDKVSESSGHITIVSFPQVQLECCCYEKRVRARKCLYLWKCGIH